MLMIGMVVSRWHVIVNMKKIANLMVDKGANIMCLHYWCHNQENLISTY